MRPTIGTVVTPFLLALAFVLSLIAAQSPQLPPCATEDSVSCDWDADTQGNGHGRSYTVDSQGNVTYR